MNVLILDGNQNQAVASVRSLARAGRTIFVGETTSWSKAGWSRSASGVLRYPPPQENVAAFLASITGFVREHPGALVLPMTEATTLPISTHRDSLIAAGARLVLPDHANLLQAFDKDETTRLAASVGVSVPATILVTSQHEARCAAKSVQYPVVLKPRTSEELSAGTVRTAGRPRYARNAAELEVTFRDLKM